MHRIFTVVALALSTTGLIAAPNITDVNLSQQGSRAVIMYNLSESAIVTVDIQTNGVSVGAALLQNVSGDVNQLVQPGTSKKKIVWKVGKAAPDVEFADAKAVVTAWSPRTPPPYLVASLSGDKEVRYYASWDAMPGTVTNEIYKTEKLVMRRIPARNVPFRMGNRVNVRPDGAYAAVLTNDFWMGVYELTQRQHELAKGAMRGTATTLAAADAATRPVERITYDYAVGGTHDEYKRNYTAFGANNLFKPFRERTGLATLCFPTEAQWEFACRAGGGTDYPGDHLADPSDDGEIAALLERIAWYADNAGGHTHTVGLKEPNAFGLYDMIGNVRELVWDWYDELKQVDWDGKAGYRGIVVDPFIAKRDTGYGMVFRRGAGFSDEAASCTTYKRNYADSWSAPTDSAAEASIMAAGIRLAATIW